MDPLESLILEEARRQGFTINAEAMRRAAVDLVGSAVTDAGLITMPNKCVISRSDFVRTLRTAMPDGFTTITDRSDSDVRRPGETMTAYMKRVNEAGRKQKDLPSNWQALKSRMTGLTLQSMNAIEKSRV